mmetsp:Transcript_7722/g.13030  ORF Transcript_7722/g.13030 Transcript_7722/m.13030 type:complete len:133 (+) Transcript_7722:269-667(+)
MCTHYNYTHNPNSSNWQEHFQCRKDSVDAEPSTLLSFGQLSVVEGRPGEMTASVGGAPPAEYWVLDVVEDGRDYSQSLLYACTNNIMKEEYIYMFSRTQEVDYALLKQWMGDLRDKGVDVSGVVLIPQNGCW